MVRLLRSRVILVVGPALICLVLAAVLFAAASDEPASQGVTNPRSSPAPAPAPASERGQPAYLVTDEQIADQRPGSPQRAVLEWWQAVQYVDVRFAHRALTPQLRSRLPMATLGRQLNDAAGGFAVFPRVAGVSATGGEASVRLNLGFQGKGGVTTVLPRSLAMTKVGGDWRVADVAYLTAEAAKGRAAREAASRAAE